MERHNERTESASSSYSEDELVALLKKAKKKMKKMKKQSRRHSEREDYAVLEGWNSPSTSINSIEPLESDHARATLVWNAISANARQTEEEELVSLLAPEVLTALGECKPVAPPISKDLAERWIPTLQGGLQAVQRDSLMNKYPFPSNCKEFDAPVLNNELRKTVTEASAARDGRLARCQRQIGVALAAIGLTITNLLAKSERDEHDLDNIARLGDAGRLLADLHHSYSESRRALIMTGKNLMKYDCTALETSLGNTLFGDNVTQILANSIQIKEACKILKAPPPKKNDKPSTSSNFEHSQYQRPQYKHPRGGYRGQRYTQRRGPQDNYNHRDSDTRWDSPRRTSGRSQQNNYHN